ncbi:acetyl-CoA carboxylase biotin carboxyl carrier protein [Rhodococcus sp. Eu-32]|uniref:acetyl-CoA carboxylase biotin carboxyl carrier protein n=1 Tax=Rhodococcus sp. Eu-32 TaxID=1017319 RepID=UPI000DF25810|nr:acetyl-CoA carboxylase biotin carboxyl carrier protein [Rhodococcus sp. Eu-32]RRQ25635.1 acetyl-CoA carboxylase biotin carboxyl carrier protein [Rhodococcus sp. Eu-32]
MDVTPAGIKLILSTLQDSEFDQAEVIIGDVRLAVARNGQELSGATTPAPAAIAAAPTLAAPAPVAPAASPAAASTGTAASTSNSGHVVCSPSVGVFWRASSPGAAPFVEVGQDVARGDTIGIVEVMKLMNNVSADIDGVVTAVHVDNAGAVEFGTPLVTIEPKA